MHENRMTSRINNNTLHCEDGNSHSIDLILIVVDSSYSFGEI